MCAGTLVHIVRYQSKTSDNTNKSRQPKIRCMLPLLVHYLFIILYKLSYLFLLYHSAIIWSFVWEVLTPLNLYVQILKRGLKWSPPLKIKLSSRSKLNCLSSFCSWFPSRLADFFFSRERLLLYKLYISLLCLVVIYCTWTSISRSVITL